jgi:hypothetical protein
LHGLFFLPGADEFCEHASVMLEVSRSHLDLFGHQWSAAYLIENSRSMARENEK